jgi:hypothetical protein
LVLVAAAGAAALWLPTPATPPSTAGRDSAPDGAPQRPDRFAALPPREAIGKPAGSPFSPQSWMPPQPQAIAPAAPAAPTVPDLPYRVAGSVAQGKVQQIILARGDVVLPVRAGDTLDGTYRVEAIQPDRMTLVYLPLGVRQDLAISSKLDGAAPHGAVAPLASGAQTGTVGTQAPAKITWDGPQRVRAGDPFKVALKLTSSEVVRAAPLQISFDPELVRPIAVRAGDFFSGGMFSYRVNPAGSIFIGASGKGAIPADAEFLVVNFEPIRPAGTAEFTLSSLNLQDIGGRAIAYQQPTAFRTTIVR